MALEISDIPEIERIYPDDKRIGHITVENHKERYKFVCGLREHRQIVAMDVCCGTGYGADMMYQIGLSVDAFDRSSEAIQYAKKRYKGPKYWVINANDDWRFGNYDIITFFEALEHFSYEDGRKILKKIKQHLTPIGMAVISVPKNCRLEVNYFHKVEYPFEMFKNILEEIFDEVTLYGQDEMTSKISQQDIQNKCYFIAVCK